MRHKNIYTLLALCMIGLIVLSSLPLAEATRARIGNARMVLRAPVGEVLERFILIENSNEFPVRIEFNVVGDLAENVVLKDVNFTMQPGEQKKAYFTIFASEAGSTETKIVISFVPEDKEIVSKASIASRVFFITEGDAVDNPGSSDAPDQDNLDNDNNSTSNDNSGSANQNTIGVGFTVADSASSLLKSTSFILIASTIILIIILIILARLYYKNQKNKGQESGKIKPKKRVKKA